MEQVGDPGQTDVHNIDQIEGLEAKITTLDTHVDAGSTTAHTISNVSGLQSTLNLKATEADLTTAEGDIAALESASVPVGGILMYSGSLASLTANWHLCDGTSGTPDLRGRFIVGAGGTYAQGATGGADTVTLTTAQIPGHTHTGPSHTHGSGTLSTGSNGSHIHNDITRRTRAEVTHGHTTTKTGVAAPPTDHTGNDTINTGSAGSHTHSISGSTASAGTGNTGSTGGGGSHENRPPYYALAYVMRIS